MKKIITLAAVISMFFSSLVFFTGCNKEEDGKIIYPNGTFIQSWMISGQSEELLDHEFQNMKDMKIEYLVYMNTACIDESGNYSEVTYPSPAAKRQSDDFYTDTLEKVLIKCKEYGIKCWVGLISDDRWWTNFDLTTEDDRNKFYNGCDEMVEVLDEVYNLYYENYKESYYGVYYAPEFFNSYSFKIQSQREEYASVCAEGFNRIITKINELNSSLPLMFSPFVNPNIIGLANASDTGKFYLDFFNKTNFRSYDVFCPQDSVGARHFPVEDTKQWYEGYKNAVENANKDITFGINCESFASYTEDENYLYPADVNTFVSQLKAASEYTDYLITFALPHYYNNRITLDGFRKSYLEYLETGETEKVPPTVPANFTGTINGSKVTLSWEPSTDDYDIAGYNVIRYSSNGAEIKTTVIRAGNFDKEIIECSLTSGYSEGNYFAIEAIDCTGNISEKAYYLKE